MKSSITRIMVLLFITLSLVMSATGPAFAQSTPEPFSKVRFLMQDGYASYGRYSAADDFVLECPAQEVLDPNHPCSQANPASGFDDLVLVCPNKEVLNPKHPCANRRAQIQNATADDFVLVCPVKEVLDPKHPCAQNNSGVKIKIPKDFVLTCPVKEVLDPYHPCYE